MFGYLLGFGGDDACAGSGKAFGAHVAPSDVVLFGERGADETDDGVREPFGELVDDVGCVVPRPTRDNKRLTRWSSRLVDPHRYTTNRDSTRYMRRFCAKSDTG